MLPQIAEAPDLSNCVDEFEFNIQERGFAGTYLSPDPDGRHNSPGMNDTKYWGPVYEICEKYDVPVFVHGTNCLDPRIAHIPGNYQVGFVVETFLTSRILCYDSKNLFSRFPGLRICIAHGGGALDRFIDSSRHRGDWRAATSTSTPAVRHRLPGAVDPAVGPRCHGVRHRSPRLRRRYPEGRRPQVRRKPRPDF